MPRHGPSPRRARRSQRGLTRDDRASGTIISYIAGIGIFLAIFAFALAFLSIYAEPTNPTQDVSLDSMASNTMEILLSSPGVPADWEDDPSSLQRLGLLKPGTQTTVSYQKVLKLQPGSDQVAYEDAKEALGLSDHEVLIQGKPVYSGDENRSALEGYDAGYVGDFEDDTGTERQPSVDGSATLDKTAVQFNNTVAGEETLLEDDPGDKYKDLSNHTNAHLLTRLAGMPYNDDDGGVLSTTARYWRMIDTHDHSQDLDPSKRNVLTTSKYDSGWDYEDGENDRIYLARLDLTDWDSDDPIWFNFTHHADGVDALTDSEDDEGHVETRPVGDSDGWTDEHDVAFISNGTSTSFENASVDITAAQGDEVYLSLEWKTNALSGEGDGWFIGNWTIEGVRDGIHKTLEENDLDYNTTTHDVLVVGSQVNHGELSADQVKRGIQQWVWGGGDIVALGSDSGGDSTQWLSPWLTDNFVDATGPILEDKSNLTHQVLNSPHILPFKEWPLSDHAYGITEDDEFTHVLVRDDGDGNVEQALSASNLDADGDGDLLLSGHRSDQLGDDERQDLFENGLIWVRHRGLYLEYGEHPHEAASAGSSQMTTLADGSQINVGYPTYKVTVHVWG